MLLLSLLYDIFFSEIPLLIHPVVYLGKIIHYFKSKFIKINNKLAGVYLSILIVLIMCFIVLTLLLLFNFNLILYSIIYCMILTSTFSIKLLFKTAKDIEIELKLGNITNARNFVSKLVSRDTNSLNESEITSATIETLSENITDSIVSPIFYFILCSIIISIFYKEINNTFLISIILLAPLIYRIFNTLDAMVGYKTNELYNIGYFPAKVDDILNFIPARIAGLCVILSAYILKYNGKNSYLILKRDACNCPSPNSGYTMASTAGALDIQLIKKNVYVMGDNNKNISFNDISKAIKLSKVSILFYLILILLIWGIIIF